VFLSRRFTLSCGPPGGVEAILFMIEAGELPKPGLGAVEAWLEGCRQAGAGELRMNLGCVPVAPAAPPGDHVETQAEFLARMASKYGAATRAAPAASLADELRAMGLM